MQMKILFYKLLTIAIITLFFGSITPSYSANITVEPNHSQYQDMNLNGRILFTPEYSKNTYLINNDGEVVHIWESNYMPGLAVYLLENGNIIRNYIPGFNPRFFSFGITGHVEEIDWNGELVWEFEYFDDQHCLHHDMEVLPNGNILMIAWEYKTEAEAIAAGRNPNNISREQLWPDHIIEVEQVGSNHGNIVWEWHVWDHLIQDYDPTKDNYGVIADHPELIDINFGGNANDWLHTNSIDYNEEFDQIILSVNFFHEFWVIDHSTTVEEAAGHTGGNSGKGGDILYRWGNPRTYRAGTISDQKFFYQHDAQWIENGCPGEGNILVFNNGKTRGYSSVDEIAPPVDNNGNYTYTPGEAYGPDEQIWIYTANNPTTFYAPSISGAQRLPDGNTLICDGPKGKFFEVTPEKVTIWQYVNPFPNPIFNNVFKIQHYPPESSEESDLDCEGDLNWINVNGGVTLYGSFQVKNIGGSGSLLDWKIESFPSWGTWSFDPEFGENLKPEDGPFSVQISVVAPNKQNKKFEGKIRVENQENPEDFDVIPVHLTTPRVKTFNIPFLDYLMNRLNIFPILRHILGLR